jgi:hypothetical protein
VARFLFDERQFSVSDGSGGVEPGALLNFYTATTTSRITTYTTASGSVQNTNPVVADANGTWPEIWIDTGQSIKWVRTDSLGANPISVDNYTLAASPPSIAAALYNFLAGTDPLPVANGGTASASGVNALVALGAMGLVGGTFTGETIQSGKGANLYNGTSGQAHGGVFVTVDSDPDPTSLAGQWWAKYA